MAALHFGVHCSECSAAEVVEIPAAWIALEPAQIVYLLAQGHGMDGAEEEESIQASESISDFLEVHESHGAKPVILHMSEIFDGRKEP